MLYNKSTTSRTSAVSAFVGIRDDKTFTLCSRGQTHSHQSGTFSGSTEHLWRDILPGTTLTWLTCMIAGIKPNSQHVNVLNPLKPNSSICYTLSYRPNLPFIIFDIQALWRSVLSTRGPECQKLKSGRLGLYGTKHLKCNHMTKLGFKALTMQLRLLLSTAKHCNNEKFIWDNCRQTCHIFILDLFNQLHNSFLHRMTCYAELLHRTTRHQCSYTAQIKTATNFGDLQAIAFDIISQSDKLLTAFVQNQDHSLYTSQLQLCPKLVTALGNRRTEIIRLQGTIPTTMMAKISELHRFTLQHQATFIFNICL